MRAVRIEEWGGPEVLSVVEDAAVPDPGAGEVLVRVALAGLNFADTHQSGNHYVAKYELPFVPGAEVAGVVERDGGGFRAGERVAGMTAAGGGYAQFAVVPAARCTRIPDDVSDAAALALLLQGLTAWHVLVTAGRLAEGEDVVVVSGAGGTGSLLVQLARSLGADRVIATASTPAKRELVRDLGADVALDTDLARDAEPASEAATAPARAGAGGEAATRRDGANSGGAGTRGGAEASDEDATRRDGAAAGERRGGHGPLRDAVLDATGGRGADVIAEMAGGPVFDQLFEALAPLGRLVVYGISSREQNDVRTGRLLKHSRSLIGLWLYHLLTDDRHVAGPLAELYARLGRGELRVVEGQTYALSDVRRAHEDLKARRTSGKLTLDPSR